jgi:signal transduction histidine kinase
MPGPSERRKLSRVQAQDFMDLIPSLWRDLAPPDLPVLRTGRYTGDGMSVRLEQLPSADQHDVRRLYATLRRAYDQLQPLAQSTSASADLRTIAAGPLSTELVQLGRAIGRQPGQHTVEVARALHDIRGGSLLAFVTTLELLKLMPPQSNDALRCFCYVRDHLKIMRNCLPEIDEVAVERDRETREHGVDLLVQKWGAGRFTSDNRERQVRFVCTYEGNVSDRCMEFSALDRVVYNLMNNAARHTADDVIELGVFRPAATTSAPVRFVVGNRIDARHQRTLAELTQANPSRLFEGGRSSTGSGLGMRICAEFVCHAFGVPTVAEAVSRGYIGVRVADDRFVAWFHWPSAS